MPFPAPWSNQDLQLFHGTSLTHAHQIVDNGVVVNGTRPNVDFGRGFYCTTIEKQAQEWAALKFDTANDTPAVVRFAVSRNELAQLDSLSFVLADRFAQDFWSLVYFCRNGGDNHARLVGTQPTPYDVVFGPLVRWKSARIVENADQVSFHTQKAQNLLNKPGTRSIIYI